MQTTTPGTNHAIAKKLSESWLPHLIETEDLFTHLEYVNKSNREIRAEALRLELQAFDDLLRSDIPTSWRFKEYRRRTIITLAGEITYLRRIYTEPSGVSHAYLDEVLGIRTRFKLAPDAFLWIARMAADTSLRKTARAFHERTGARISHWLVMEVAHEEGPLIFEDLFQRAFGGKGDGTVLISNDTLYVEFDGIHIALQKSFHEPRKARWAYEQNRKKNSFELKVGCFYAGKDSKRRRVGCFHFAADETPERFWPLMNAKIASVYDIADIDTVHSSADAAGWCKNNGLEVLATATNAVHHLDCYHLNREIRKAFGGDTEEAGHFISLAYRKRTKRMFRDLQRVINHVKDKTRYLRLQAYLSANRKLVEQGAGPSMGTQEGTNAHVYAARMKVWGGAWSRKGAAAMAAIRARIASGEDLIAPKPDNVFYNDQQLKRRAQWEKRMRTFNYDVAYFEGEGYEPPRGEMALTTHMPPSLYGVLNYT